MFLELAKRFPQYRFAWLDIENNAGLVGDLEIETFPTLLLADESGTRFFGPLTPQPETLSRLLVALDRNSLSTTPNVLLTQSLLQKLQAAPEHWLDTGI